MKAITLEVPWGARMNRDARVKLQEGNSKETFAQSLKECGLNDSPLLDVGQKTGNMIASEPVVVGLFKQDVTNGEVVAARKAEAQSKDVVSDAGSGFKSSKEEINGLEHGSQTDVKPNVDHDTAGDGEALKRFQGRSKAERAVTTTNRYPTLSKKQKTPKSAKDAVINTGSTQERSFRDESAALPTGLRIVGSQQDVLWGSTSTNAQAPDPEKKCEGNIKLSFSKLAGPDGQGEPAGIEDRKNRLSKTSKESFIENFKEPDVIGISGGEITKSGAKTAITAKEETVRAALSAEKIEGAAVSGVGTAMPNGLTGFSHLNNVGELHHAEKNPALAEVPTATRLDTASLLNLPSAGHRDNYGPAGESGPALLGATTTALEVGMVSGTHGWLKIRAEIEDGVVTASLSARSTAAQEMLHHTLPALTSFLQEERISASTVMVKQMSSGSTGDMNHGSGMQNQARSGQEGANAREGYSSVGGDDADWGFGDQGSMPGMWREMREGAGFLPAMAGGSGGWLNVQA